MLVLSRKPGEKLIVADGLITITVVRIGPNTVRLGIDCPKDINIVREELVTTETVVDGGEIVTSVIACDFPTPQERAEYREAMEQRKKPRGRIRDSK